MVLSEVEGMEHYDMLHSIPVIVKAFVHCTNWQLGRDSVEQLDKGLYY